ncbi:GIN domain-containing protein [Agrobacterium tumefaciens]|uniref:GIN domain-containing protein n=1 Tax=Agrobacterium tumefaciens TaxID=358 RepID=UPI001574A1CD|nr:DUF2807 domain-containing protein [Agrobacterium tumefaciens]
MTKLASWAAAGLAVSIATLILTASLSTTNWAAEQLWPWDASRSCNSTTDASPVSISLPLEQRDDIDINMPASISYQPGPMSEAVITGDPSLAQHVRFINGRLGFDSTINCMPTSRLTIRITGPSIRTWMISGSNDLTLSELHQKELQLIMKGSSRVVATGAVEAVTVRVSGSGQVELREISAKSVNVDMNGSGNMIATGSADAITLAISGSGQAELQRLAAKSANVDVHGAGIAQISARDSAEVTIAGKGLVKLHERPTQLNSKVSGSGRLENE